MAADPAATCPFAYCPPASREAAPGGVLGRPVGTCMHAIYHVVLITIEPERAWHLTLKRNHSTKMRQEEGEEHVLMVQCVADLGSDRCTHELELFSRGIHLRVFESIKLVIVVIGEL